VLFYVQIRDEGTAEDMEDGVPPLEDDGSNTEQDPPETQPPPCQQQQPSVSQPAEQQQRRTQLLTTSTPRSAPKNKRAKRQSEEDKSLSVIGHYFAQKSAAAEATNDSATRSDTAFGTVIECELKKITNPAIKRTVKKQMLDIIFAGQEADEQQQVFQLIVAADQAPSAASTAPSEVSTAGTNSSTASAAEVLVQLQQQ